MVKMTTIIEHKQLHTLDDYFSTLNMRPEKGVYFYRINGWSEEIRSFLKKYYDAAGKNGVIIEGRIQNPTEQNLAYYSEMMGMAFRPDRAFIAESLKKWLPRMNDSQRSYVASSMYDALAQMQHEGKNENMLKNAYIKFMCWLYYKFERIVNRLGENEVPKILYDGIISRYELILISILSGAGCDVVLLQQSGDQGYLRLDPQSRLSLALSVDGLSTFPAGFSLQTIREDIQRDLDRERLFGQRPQIRRCTNAWISGKWKEDILTDTAQRGTDEGFFYNCFCRVNGVEDRTSYGSELLSLLQDLKNAGRSPVIVNESIPAPTPEEIAGIRRSNYTRQDQMIMELSRNLMGGANPELQRLMHQAFAELLLEEADRAGMTLNRLTNKAVYLLCWLKRYSPALPPDRKKQHIGCFIYMGGCNNENETLFLRMLSRLPVDVLVLKPDLKKVCCLKDPLLYEVHYAESLSMRRYPEDGTSLHIGTAAYHAERDLDTLIYQDTGIYRNQQYEKANVINLQTMYEEIRLLWDVELKYRPNFSTSDGVVNLPVICAKVSGVKDGDLTKYWAGIRELMTEDAIVIKNPPYISSTAVNPMKALAPEFYRNGKLMRGRMKSHPKYPYGILREDVQEFMLDKLELMITQKLIRGIGENGMEYTVIAQVLNLPKDILRQIQKFDFTKKNPKLIYINTTESHISVEDSIIAAYLNLIGFDTLFFVPTGYQSVERHFAKPAMEEHQIGGYEYDLAIPDLNSIPSGSAKTSWRDKIFKRGN